LIQEINGSAVGDSWSKIIIIYNSGNNYTVNIPEGNWTVAMENGLPPYENSNKTVTNSIEIEGTAVTILYQN
jgi:pullulanase